MTINTIEEIYAAINPMPAMLSAKGKVRPAVTLLLEANTRICLLMAWHRDGSKNDWETESKGFLGDDFDEALAKATAFINALPDAETANLHRFMDKLGKLIDAGRESGIELDYLNPLTDTMKRLSENIITYKPEAA